MTLKPIHFRKGEIVIVNYDDRNNLMQSLRFDTQNPLIKSKVGVSQRVLKYKGNLKDYLALLFESSSNITMLHKYLSLTHLSDAPKDMSKLSYLQKRYYDLLNLVSSNVEVIVLEDVFEGLSLYEQRDLLKIIHQMSLDGFSLIIISNLAIYPEYDNVQIINIGDEFELPNPDQVSTRKLEVKDGRGDVRFISFEDIIYVESTSGVVVVVTKEKDYTTPLKMYELETLLGVKDFMRVHKSYIVNMTYVEGYNTLGTNIYEVVIKDIQDPLPLSRNKVQQLKGYLNNATII